MPGKRLSSKGTTPHKRSTAFSTLFSHVATGPGVLPLQTFASMPCPCLCKSSTYTYSLPLAQNCTRIRNVLATTYVCSQLRRAASPCGAVRFKLDSSTSGKNLMSSPPSPHRGERVACVHAEHLRPQAATNHSTSLKLESERRFRT